MAEVQVDARGKPRHLFQTVFEDESLTVQSDAHKADIQQILKRYGATGMVDHLARTDAQFADVSELGDYADVMRVAREAEFEFMKLPSKIRERFDHDVAKWLDAAHDQEKRDAVVLESAEAAGSGAGEGAGAPAPGGVDGEGGTA